MFNIPTLFFILAALLLPGYAYSDVDSKPKVAEAKPTKELIKSHIARTKENLAYLPGGSFEMGDWGDPVSGLPYDYKLDSKPLHKVTLDSFSIMKYKVTYAEFDLFTAAKGLPKINTHEVLLKSRAPDNPAGVSWYGAKAYCRWLAELTRFPFDLPTEAQWEFAARSGGRRVLFSTDNGQADVGRNTPSYEQMKELGVEFGSPIIPVGKFPPNPAGLYGMGELVREWVNDWYDPKYYSHSPVKNPKGPSIGVHKVQRGDFGDSAEMVFMRGDSPPQRTDMPIPLEGYSSLDDDTFRCVVHQSTKVK